tara:strand:- start:975 stop:3257 length:2283 start_codon:yes stop_codon:yes gene_type:complete
MRFTEQNPPAVGKQYNLESGTMVFSGGDWTKKENWAKPDTWSATGAKIRGKITAEGRYNPALPELATAPELYPGGNIGIGKGRTGGAAFKTSLGLLTSGAHEKDAINIIKNNLPDAKINQDQYGNTTVALGGKDYYINKPGWSTQDTMSAVFKILGFIGIGNKLGIGNKGVGIGGNMLRAGGTGGILSVSEDVISQASGAQRSGALSTLGLANTDLGIDIPKAAQTAAITSVFQGGADVLFSAIPSLANALRNTQIKLGATDDSMFGSSGELTTQGQQILKQLGVEWNSMTKEFKDRLRNQFVSDKLKPASTEEAVAYAEAQSLPIVVPQTKGTLSGDAERQLLEDLARKGVYGEEAKIILQQARIDAEKAITSNMSEIQKIIAGSAPIINRGQGGTAAQAELFAARQSAKSEANKAYDTARDLSAESGTVLPSNIFKGFGDDVKTVVTKDHAINDLASVKDFLKQFKDLGAKDSTVSIRSLFDLRKQLTTKARGGKGDESSVALNKMKIQLDNKIDSLLETALLQGDDIVIKSWRDAIKGYKDYKQKWESGNLMDRLTRINQQSGNRELVVAPESASNYIFNSSNLGFINKANLQRDILKMKENLSPESWSGMRQEIYLKIINASKTAQKEGISGAKLQTNINKVLQDNKPLMSALYTPKEIALLEQFARVANRTLNTQKNTSNTGAAQMNALKNMWTNVVAVLGIKNANKWIAAIPGLKAIGTRYKTSQINQSIDASPTIYKTVLGPTPGAIGTTTTQ